jgi:UDP-GlcNAc:undecaprenyl-phosphate GlcNAc-1-phosphate transferase
MKELAFYYGLAFAVSLLSTFIVRRTAYRLGFIAAPSNKRWHRKPTALLGGIAIVVSFYLPFLLTSPKNTTLWTLAIASLLMFALGLFDDLKHIKPQSKLIGQIIAASVLIYAGFLLRLTDYAAINVLITLVWIVGITNAFNLLDNMDGLCTGVALIASTFRFLFFLMDNNYQSAVTTLIFMGALSGFLFFNFNPASIFMGDSGSLFIGFFLSGLNLAGGFPYTKSMFSVLLFPILILIIPIFDTTFVTLVRKFSGRPISVGGTDHTSHRLVAVGLSERRAVMILYAIAIVSGYIAFVLYRHGFSYGILFLSFLAISMLLLGIYLSKIKVYEENQAQAVDEKNVFQLVADLPYKRQILSILFDLCLVVLAYYSAYLLRFENSPFAGSELLLFTASLPIVIIAHMTAAFYFGVYRSVWRYTGLRDLIGITKASLVGTIGAILFLLYATRFVGFSRAVFIIYTLLLIVLLAGARLSFNIFDVLFQPTAQDHKKVVIYGAGDGGELVLRELLNNRELKKTVVGFIDDDRGKYRTIIHGLPVLGSVNDLDPIINKHAISEVIISSNKISENALDILYEICRTRNISVQRASIRFEECL